MLVKAKSLNGYTLKCVDGEIGTVKDFIFDDREWSIRYLDAETGNWLMDRQVLISPHALVSIDKETKHITTNLTVKQIESSPSLFKDLPISPEFDSTYHNYYGWPANGTSPYMWGANQGIMQVRNSYKAIIQAEKDLEPGLRSAYDIYGRKIHAPDGEFGNIEDFIIDDEFWAVRYLVIDTVSWWPSKKVLISPKWIDHLGLDEFKVFVNVPHETIKHAPEYTDGVELNREFEDCLHKYYQRENYWDELPACFKDKE